MRAHFALRALFWGLSGGLLLLAACAPAAKPGPAPSGQTSEEKPTTQTSPAQQGSQKPAAEQQPAAAKPATSVSGIPLDPNARFGGVLIESYNTEGPTYSTWEEAAGNSFVIASKTLNHCMRNQVWGSPENWVAGAYETLQPDLCTSWEQSADGLQWVFKLRQGVKWSDGTPFTCADTKWSYDTIRTGQGLKRSPRATHWLAVKEITCPDDLTMVVHMQRPKPGAVYMAGAGFNAIRPKHVYENNMDALRNEPPKVGTGPFTVKEALPGEKYVFARRNDYWDQPFPYLDGIELKFLTTQAATTAMRAGRLDVFSLSGIQADTLVKECDQCVVQPSPNPALAKGSPSCGWCPSVLIHQQRPPWNTPEIEDAISLAFDKKKMSGLYTGWRPPVPDCGFYPGSYWAMPAERCKAIPGFNHDDPEGNKQKARELLAKAGYKPGELKLNFNLWVSYQELAPFIDEDLRSVGFDPKITIVETARNYDVLTAGDFDVHLHGFAIPGSQDPDWLFYELFYTGSDRNYMRYSRPEVDRMIDDMSQTLDREERRRKAWDIMETVLRDHPHNPLMLITSAPVYNKRVRGWIGGGGVGTSYGPFSRLEHAWIQER